jgi:hypothetical protein
MHESECRFHLNGTLNQKSIKFLVKSKYRSAGQFQENRLRVAPLTKTLKKSKSQVVGQFRKNGTSSRFKNLP